MFFDIHAHAYRKPCPFPNRFALPEELLPMYDRLGIEQAALLPLVSPEVYLPQSNDDILEMAEKWPDRFIPFCNIDPRTLRNTCDTPLGDLLRYFRDRGCRGIGEVMPNLPFLHPLVLNLFKHVQDVGFPLIFDGAPVLGRGYGLYDDPGMPQFERCLQLFPNLIFLGHGPPFWAEIARLETPMSRGGYPKGLVQEEGVVPKLMRKYGNLWGDLSAGSGYNALARDPDYAVKFLNEFQDRLAFGTDICTPDATVPLPEFLQDLRKRGLISDTVFEKIARGNARRLLKL